MADGLTGLAIEALAISSRSGTGRDMDPLDPLNMSLLVAFEWTQGASESRCLKDYAFPNMLSIFIALETSHLDTSPLNNLAPKNMSCMSVTLDTSHLEMSPANATA